MKRDKQLHCNHVLPSVLSGCQLNRAGQHHLAMLCALSILQVIGTLGLGSEEDLSLAVAAAQEALPSWKHASGVYRAGFLRALSGKV